MSKGCKQSPRSWGGKNKTTDNEGCASIIEVNLLRTDTTLDLSQEARVVKISSCPKLAFIGMGDAHRPIYHMTDTSRYPFGTTVSVTTAQESG